MIVNQRHRCRAWGLVFLLPLLAPAGVRAEDGHAAWLRYAPLDAAAARRVAPLVPTAVVALEDAAPILRARDEIARGVQGILGRTLRQEPAIPAGGALVLATTARLRDTDLLGAARPVPDIGSDGYWLVTVRKSGASYTLIAGGSARAVLYGAFAYLQRLALGNLSGTLDAVEVPAAAVRWVNHWDNIDGTIERGYGGRSLFWEGGRLRDDLTAAGEYARLLASIGINGLSINNVNANPVFLTPELLPQIAKLADVFRPWGIRLALAVDFASPTKVGGLDTYDPLSPAVSAWWAAKATEIYAAVPDLAGIVLKADSEGRVGPSAYKRTHADAANVIARALAPHGGLLFYRGFVYDHRMDWRNLKNDRARAAYDNFKALDGRFERNAIVQIKHGPIDFQVREPASPLFGALRDTSEAVELQITQEYFGQARHTVFLVPLWKEALDFDMQMRGAGTPVKAIVSGRTWGTPTGGFVGVSNAGRDVTWFGNHLSQANLYGFGRLAWNPDLAAAGIANDWTRLTFGHDPSAVRFLTRVLMESWPTYENYTGPLGLQTLTDIVGNHYGVSVEASERNGWGQWHRADEAGVGMNRTVATGTGFAGQYSPAVAAVYESLQRVPDELVLFFHHVPYTHRLRSGRTVIQYVYDSHYDGADAVAGWVRDWKALRGRVDDERHEAILRQLEYQAGQAIVWRDAVTRWFHRTSGIADAKGRVGTYPHRLEAESAAFDGYVTEAVKPWEAASGDGAVNCTAARCTAAFTHRGRSGTHDVVIQYFDVNTGRAQYRVRVGDAVIAEWTAGDWFPTRTLDGSSSTRRLLQGIHLRTGDRLVVEGLPEGGEGAALDYVEIRPGPAR